MTLRAYPTGKAIIRPSGSTDNVIHLSGSNQSCTTAAEQCYITIDGFVLDGSNLLYDPLLGADCFKAESGASYTILQASELGYCPWQGVLIAAGSINNTIRLDFGQSGR